MTDAVETFESLRPFLAGLAYRMLGSRADADDIVQDAWLRWDATDRTAITNPHAFLSRVVTRLALDRLKSAQVRRESYIGSWLPEPIVEDMTSVDTHADAHAELASDLSFALLLALERLSPLERAAFLLHDVFDVEFEQVAETLDRSPAAVRQLAARAREHVRSCKPRFPVSPEEGSRLTHAFLDAIGRGDVDSLGQLLAADAVLMTDGGGRVRAALNPILGRDHVLRFLLGVTRKNDVFGNATMQMARVNGMPGFIIRKPDGSIHWATALEPDGAGGIAGVYVISNPDKLALIQ